jgi:uncharacterized MAPEG superfamily protein
MTIANWCVLLACLLPVITVGLAKASGSRTSPKEGGYNNNRPRDWEATLTGWQKRAVAAQNNSFEALPLFIAAVLLAQQAHGDQSRIDLLAIAFIAIRIAYVAAYITNRGLIRSLIWSAGVGVSIAIFFS